MSKPSHVTAKDLAFERERLTWRHKLRAEQESHDKTREQLLVDARSRRFASGTRSDSTLSQGCCRSARISSYVP